MRIADVSYPEGELLIPVFSVVNRDLQVSVMNILFLGHSLIEFFDWQKRFPGHHVSNLGVAGESVEGLLGRLDGVVRTCEADLIFIMTGINNIAMDDHDFFGPYRKIVRTLRNAYPHAGIYVHSLLPVNVEFISNDIIKDANRSVEALAKEENIGYIDLYSDFTDEQGRPIGRYLLDDGVHLSDEGYAVWSGVLQSIIDSKG